MSVSRKALEEFLNGHINIGKPGNSYTEGRVDAYNIVLRELEKGRFSLSESEGEAERMRMALEKIFAESGYESDYPGTQLAKIQDYASEAFEGSTSETAVQPFGMQMALLKSRDELFALKKGDTVVVKWSERAKEFRAGTPFTVNIIHGLNEKNEVILNRSKNSFFDVDAYIDGDSSAEEVYLLGIKDGREGV